MLSDNHCCMFVNRGKERVMNLVGYVILL